MGSNFDPCWGAAAEGADHEHVTETPYQRKVPVLNSSKVNKEKYIVNVKNLVRLEPGNFDFDSAVGAAATTPAYLYVGFSPQPWPNEGPGDI